MERKNGSDHSSTAPAVALPSPQELATIAATLLPKSLIIEADQKAKALETAMGLYFEAKGFLQDLPKNPQDLLLRFDGERYIKLLVEESDNADWETNALRYNPRTYSDRKDGFHAAIDEIFKSAGVKTNPWKTARSMTHNVERLRETLTANGSKHLPLVEAMKRQPDGETIYVIPRRLVEDLVQDYRNRQAESKRRSWEKRREKTSQKESSKKPRLVRRRANVAQRKSSPS